MVASHTEAFTDAVRNVGAAVTRTAADEFVETLDGVVTEPAVGTPLPFEDVSYDATVVAPSPTGAAVNAADTGVTAGALGIAEYGSVVLQETGAGEELISLYPDRHVVVVARSDVVPDMASAYEAMSASVADGLDDAIIATGPSATADMGSVVSGVHGPRDVHVVVIEDR